ncbi:MAG: polysaccharide deacetylase family protein [Anaerolineae bacterium]
MESPTPPAGEPLAPTVVSDFPATPAPTPLPAASPTPMPPAPEPTASPTSTPTRTPTATATKTPPPTQTPTLTPTPTRTPVPTPVVSATEVLRGNKQKPWVALTFDADAAADPAPLVLDTLKQYQVRATFFILGWWATRHPDLVRRMVAEGHEIGNHSNTHPDFRTLTREQMVEELSAAEAIIQEVAGRTSKPFFRPPYSYRNELVRQVAAEEGYLTVVWTIDAFDWRPAATQESILQQILENVVPGAIIVQHVGDANTAAVLPRVIEELRARGFELVTLSEVLAP